MDSVTLTLYIAVGIIVVMLAVYFVGYFKSFKRNKSSVIKAPKMRARAILQDDENFGSAVVHGVEYIGSAMNRGYVLLMGQDGRMFKQHYWEDQVYPKNSLQALGGAERALWGVKAAKSKRNENDGVIETDKQLFKMRNEGIVQKAEALIKVNEAATLPDQINELIDKLSKQPKEQIKFMAK